MTKYIKLFFWVLLFTSISSILGLDVAYAGMPSIVLTDIAKLRLITISFFLFVYLGASLVIFALWNYLQRDFSKLPRLSFSKAMALVFLWALAFELMLVMIAGTRELMTPKAWEKAGIVYKLSPDGFEQLLATRRHKLEMLKKELWSFAEKNEGKFPSKDAFSEDIWLEPTGKTPYNYVAGLTIDSPLQPLVYEPDSYGEERMVLFTNGNIELLSLYRIEQLIEEAK